MPDWRALAELVRAPAALSVPGDVVAGAAAAHGAGRAGPLTELAFFFKDPLGEVDHALGAQFEALATFVRSL